MPDIDDLPSLPLVSQVAVLGNEVKNQGRTLTEVKGEVREMKRALWGLILSVLAGMILFLVGIAAGWIGGAP